MEVLVRHPNRSCTSSLGVMYPSTCALFPERRKDISIPLAFKSATRPEEDKWFSSSSVLMATLSSEAKSNASSHLVVTTTNFTLGVHSLRNCLLSRSVKSSSGSSEMLGKIRMWEKGFLLQRASSTLASMKHRALTTYYVISSFITFHAVGISTPG